MFIIIYFSKFYLILVDLKSAFDSIDIRQMLVITNYFHNSSLILSQRVNDNSFMQIYIINFNICLFVCLSIYRANDTEDTRKKSTIYVTGKQVISRKSVLYYHKFSTLISTIDICDTNILQFFPQKRT